MSSTGSDFTYWGVGSGEWILCIFLISRRAQPLMFPLFPILNLLSNVKQYCSIVKTLMIRYSMFDVFFIVIYHQVFA